MERNLGSQPIVAHSPGSHYHAQLSKMELSSSSSNFESDVSDMVIDNQSKFKDLNKQRRKSGGSDYNQPSDSNLMSESESESGSMSGDSYSNRSKSASLKPDSLAVSHGERHSEDDSEESSSRSSLLLQINHSKVRHTPIVRKSPLNVTHRSSPSEVTSIRGYRYSMLPFRSAATNVSYSRYMEDEADSDSSTPVGVNWRRKLQKESESEFEVSDRSEASVSEEFDESEEDFSEAEYQPRKGKSKTSRRKDWEESGSDSDYQPTRGGKRRRGKVAKRNNRRSSDGYRHSFVSDGGTTGSSSESEFEPGYVSKQRKKKKRKQYGQKGLTGVVDSPSDYVRTTGRSKGVVSYKDFYGSDVDGSGEGEGMNEEKGEEEGEAVIPVEDNREAIEKILKKRIGRPGDTGNKTTCYSCCLEAGSDPEVLARIGQGDKESIAKVGFSFNVPPLPPGEPREVQYLVKWGNWSHLHNTWETESSLTSQDIKGMKKFYNFLKKEEEKELWERDANPEDIEYIKCQEELAEQLLEQFTQVERVIASRSSDEGTREYLCKWRGLPYSECTWEDGDLISGWFQKEIDAFIERDASDCIPNKNAKVLRHRPKFIYMKEQLRSLGRHGKFVLRDYQLEGVNWLVKSWCKNNSVILADEMGLGKTIQTIAFLHCLFHIHQLYGPFLIVVPLSTMPAWQREFEQWAPEMSTVVYIGDITSRNKIKEFEWCHSNKKLKFNTILTTYEILLKDKEFLGSVAWSSLIVDEAHRLKNDDSLLYRTLMEFRTNHRLLITGTPLQNSLKELWSLLHFIMEKQFSSWEEFDYEHHAYGEGDASSLISIHQQLQPYLLRRIKKDVEKSLPAKVEQILRVEMSSVQKQYYRWILTKNYKALSKGVKGSITGFINIMMELKKCCNHVWIVRSPDDKEAQEKDKLQTLIRGSGKLYLLDKLLVRLYKTGHRVLIFSQMVRMLDILAEYMRLRHFHFQRLDGSIRGDKRKDAIDHFNTEGSQDFCFLLSTRAGGLGVNLATADTVVIFDSDWNPQNDIQAQARAHRIGQKKQVNIYRLVTKNSVEEDIIERAKKKMVLDHLVIQRMDTTGRTVLSANKEPSKSVPFNKDELNAILKFGAEELFKSREGCGASEDKELLEMDIDDILQRAETQSSSEDTSHSDLLSQFKVASFAMDEEELAPPPLATPTDGKPLLLSPRESGHPIVEKSWEELIPSEDRQRVDEEAKTQEQLELYLPPRQRTVRNYCEDQTQKPATSHTRTRTRNTRSGAPSNKDTVGYDTIISKKVHGFTDSEIRRFVKSYRKFINPVSRLEGIAADAELQEKSFSELQRLMTVLHEGCVQAEEEHRARMETKPDYNPKKDKGASLRLCGVTLNTSGILRREEELAALACVIPANPAVRKKYRLLSRPKGVHWEGIKWTAVDDAKLLVGIYEYGIGNWESIKDDFNLGLTNKILRPDPSLKPQASHLQTRVEYLLKLLQVEAAEKMRKKSSKNSKNSKKTSSSKILMSKSVKKKRKVTGSLPRSGSPPLTVNILRELLDAEGDSDADSNASGVAHTQSRRKASSNHHYSETKKTRLNATETSRNGGKANSRRRKDRVFIPGERTSPRKKRGHETESKGEEEKVGEVRERTSDLEDNSGVVLDDKTFQKCKSMLKPVKKSMLELHPKEEDAEKDPLAMDQFEKVLVEIGDHITSSLSGYDPENISLWKTNLWVFVSKFTTASPQKLHKIYKKAKKPGDLSRQPSKRKHDEMSCDSTSQLPTSHKLEDSNDQKQPTPQVSSIVEHSTSGHRQASPPQYSEGGHNLSSERERSSDRSMDHFSGMSHRHGEEIFRHKEQSHHHHHHHHHDNRHHHEDRRRRHSSSSSYHSDASSSKRPRHHFQTYHHPTPSSSASHRPSSHSNC